MEASSGFCPNCGAANQPQQTHCFACGQPLTPAVGAPTGRLAADILLNRRYRIVRAVGKGGMGAVYEAEDTLLGNRMVAVKEMSQQGLSGQDLHNAAENFKREANLLAQLQHPNLPVIYDYFSEGGRWYLVMNFIPGETLEAYLHKAKKGRLLVQEALQIGIELCSVLDYLHRHHPPIVFRDLKPSNIMRTPQGQLYLIDFGIARHFKPGQAKDTAIYGSAGYSAPEQYGRSQTTPRSDIYSLGALLYQLLSGHHPATTPFRFPPLQSFGLALPSGLSDLIMQMLDMDESKRPKDIATVRQDLQRFVGNAAPTQMVPPPPPVVQKQVLLQAVVPSLAGTNGGIWSLGGRQLRAIVIGILLCGLLEFWLDRGSFAPWFHFHIANVTYPVGFGNIIDMLVLVLAIFFGAIAGPWVGLIVGAASTLGVDYFAGLGVMYYTFLWNWDVRVALAGFIAGLVLLRTKGRYNSRGAIILTNVVAIVAIILGSAFANLTDIGRGEAAQVAGTTFLYYTAIDIVLGAICLSLLLVLYNRRNRGAMIA